MPADKKLLVAALVVIVPIFALAQTEASSSSSSDDQLPKLEHFDPLMADKSKDPCTDFYQYACGKWMAANPIPADQPSWGTDSPLRLWNETILRQTLEHAELPTAERSANDQKIGDFYAACMDEKQLAETTPKDIKPELDRINAMNDKHELAEELAHLHSTLPEAWNFNDDQTDTPGFGFAGQPDYAHAAIDVAYIDQGGMGMPGRDYYLEKDAKSQEIRDKYLKHISNILVLGGEKRAQADADAKIVMAMETEMARAMMDPVKRRDPKNTNNPMTFAQVKALTPAFDWQAYLDAIHAPESPKYIVTSPAFFKAWNHMIEEHPLKHWKTYLRWQMLHHSAPYLSADFENEDFDFFGRTLFGTKEQLPRWRRCVRRTDEALGEALGQAYVARAFPPEDKERVLKMVRDIETEMGKDIEAQDWMAPQTKQQALVKLHAVLNKIGYPDKWRDYSSVQITRNDFLEDVHNTDAFEFHRWVNKIDKPMDRTEWGMTPPTINAYEDPQTNTINFPAGILQPPYFEVSQDDAANYGSVGAVIGHELIHSFDDQGRKFDAQGDLRDWWTANDAKEYETRGKCISNEYTQYVPEAGAKQNGLLTQGEDTADNGGTHLAYDAFHDAFQREGKDPEAKDASGFTADQRYFIAYANSWCTNMRPELMHFLVLTNPHSAPKYRVNNVVANMPEFWKAFSCKRGQPMARVNACRIW
jgi:endothelin-converting enzyme/putative endopeptidase